MEQFLYKLADNFYNLYKQDVSDITFVFPNRRSGIFFKRYLSRIADKPILSPRIKNISELFSELSDLKLLDKTKMLFTLFDIYKDLNNKKIDFDEFVYWGEVMLNDFDDIDKYIVDAKKLFSNISDIKDIDKEYEYLEEEQKNIICGFWSNFLPYTESDKKRNFIEDWSSLHEIYLNLINRLKAEGFAYEGMLYRDVIENLRSGKTLNATDKIVFVGFNALTKVERELMKYLRDAGNADFYWDYESVYLDRKSVV